MKTTQANRTEVVYYTQEEIARREKRRKFLLDYHSRMSMIQDFGACIYIEMVQQYWLKASKKIKKSDVYCRKIKAWTNSADKAMSILMRYVQRADEAWTQAVCKPFPIYAKDFTADGYSFANRLQYNHHQMTKGEKRKLEFTIKNALLAVNCEYTDIVTDVYMAFLFTQTLTFMQDDIWDCLKREAAKDEHPVVKFQKNVIVELSTMLGATANIVAMLKSQDLRDKDEVSVLNGSKIINRAYWHKDTIKTCLRYESSMCNDYALYVVAKWLLKERQKSSPFTLLDELSKHFSVEEIGGMQGELRKMRVGLGEDDPVELAKVICKAKNTPMLDELRLFILTGERELTMEFVSFEIAKKLKEKGFPQVKKNTLAMYGEDGCIYNLCPTLDINKFYYAFDDFDEHDCVCPTISQVLKWLREEHHLHFEVVGAAYGYNLIISDTPDKGGTDRYFSHANNDGSNYAGAWDKYEDCVMYGIEYVLNKEFVV